MRLEQLRQDHTQAAVDCEALEQKAGIGDRMERAREGRFIPLGAMGEKVTPDEYFADEYDYLRAKTRDAYFSVQDIDLRKQLIAARRQIATLLRRLEDEQVASARHEAEKERASLEQAPWGMAAITAGACVAIGYSLFSTVGAIGGAVAGFFMGQGVIGRSRNLAAQRLRQAESDLEDVIREKREDAIHPEFFSIGEERSGKRDTTLDAESAYANLMTGRSTPANA